MNYPKEQTEFLQAVYDMRMAQRGYYAHRTDGRLKVAKHKEQRVDTLMQHYVDAGVPVVSNLIIQPPKLF